MCAATGKDPDKLNPAPRGAMGLVPLWTLWEPQARAAAPVLMEEGARLALEAAAGYLDGRGGIVIPGTVAFASLVSGNNQPCMSGNPADRLHPPQRRKFDDATATLAEAIRALDPAAIVKGAGRD